MIYDTDFGPIQLREGQVRFVHELMNEETELDSLNAFLVICFEEFICDDQIDQVIGLLMGKMTLL